MTRLEKYVRKFEDMRQCADVSRLMLAATAISPESWVYVASASLLIVGDQDAIDAAYRVWGSIEREDVMTLSEALRRRGLTTQEAWPVEENKPRAIRMREETDAVAT